MGSRPLRRRSWRKIRQRRRCQDAVDDIIIIFIHNRFHANHFVEKARLFQRGSFDDDDDDENDDL